MTARMGRQRIRVLSITLKAELAATTKELSE
jgi:hypothetical protein